MTSERDDFPESVKRVLATRVRNECSNPDCRTPTSGPQADPSKALNIGVAAHITAASELGPRYDASLTPEQRCHISNGIWLCQNCGKLVDNDDTQFPEDLLRAWKELAECRARYNIGKTMPLPITAPESESQRKKRAILEWKGKIVTHSQMYPPEAAMRVGPKISSSPMVVFDCTEHYVRIGTAPGIPGGWSKSIPLDNVTIGFDDAGNRLELQERYT